MTKGACNKIILSVNKLVRRPGTLAELEQVSCGAEGAWGRGDQEG